MARKRTKENELAARWSKRENDLMFFYPGSKVDGHYLYNVLSKAVTDELDSRGYDIKTLRFSVLKKEKP